MALTNAEKQARFRARRDAKFKALEQQQPRRVKKVVVVEVAPTADAPPADTPLGYMLQVMNDETADEARRDKMAVAAAPFMHPRVADNRFGKRDGEKEAATRAGKSGRFASPATPPKLVVSNS